MNTADWAILIVVAISGLISLKRGFVKEALSLVVWLLAFIVAMMFREPMRVLLARWIETPSLQLIAAFGLLFIITLFVGSLVASLIGKLVKATGLSGTDRYLGFCFGLARGLLVVLSALMLLPGLVPIDQDVWWRESVLIPELLKLEPVANDFAVAIHKLVTGWFSQSV